MAACAEATCSGEPKTFSHSFVPLGYCASLAFNDATSVAVYWFMLAIIWSPAKLTFTLMVDFQCSMRPGMRADANEAVGFQFGLVEAIGKAPAWLLTERRAYKHCFCGRPMGLAT